MMKSQEEEEVVVVVVMVEEEVEVQLFQESPVEASIPCILTWK
jgi:hypothetical protein